MTLVTEANVPNIFVALLLLLLGKVDLSQYRCQIVWSLLNIVYQEHLLLLSCDLHQVATQPLTLFLALSPCPSGPIVCIGKVMEQVTTLHCSQVFHFNNKKTITGYISVWVCHVKRIMESSASKEFIHPSGHSPGDTEGVDVVAFSVYSSAQKMFLICSMFKKKKECDNCCL